MMHVCTGPIMFTDRRRNNQWYPPKHEKRARCKTCGWQGRWVKELEEATDEDVD